MVKKIIDLNPKIRSELKSTKEVMENTINNLVDSSAIIKSLKLEIEVQEQEIEHLKKLLKDSEVPTLERKSHEEEIIQVELNRLHQTYVINNIPLVDKDDIKKLETLVKSLSIIRSGQIKKEKKEKPMSIEDALDIMANEVK